MLIINDLQKENAGFWQKKAQKGGFIRNLGQGPSSHQSMGLRPTGRSIPTNLLSQPRPKNSGLKTVKTPLNLRTQENCTFQNLFLIYIHSR
jgi:hypothetical protein